MSNIPRLTRRLSLLCLAVYVAYNVVTSLFDIRIQYPDYREVPPVVSRDPRAQYPDSREVPHVATRDPSKGL